MPRRSKKPAELDPATRDYQAGVSIVYGHPMFSTLLAHALVSRCAGNLCPTDGWAVVTDLGIIHVHPQRRAQPEEWAYILAHCLLHLGLGHFQPRTPFREWNTACDCVIARFLADLKLGRPPEGFGEVTGIPTQVEEKLFGRFVHEGIPPDWNVGGTAGPHGADMYVTPPQERNRWRTDIDWRAHFEQGLIAAVSSAVDVAGGQAEHLGALRGQRSPAERAREWFMSSYPLLGALAASIELIENWSQVSRMQVSVAAVDPELRELYINPQANLSETEHRFVIAHELLHVGLRHAQRREGRDPYLWNVACDYVINGWLAEMGLGTMPRVGLLYDPELKGMSAEAIYERIANDLRRYRKLATLRGYGLGDILGSDQPDWWASPDGQTLEEFYRRCLSQGLTYHEFYGRGLLPAGLLEELRALQQPPIPWDVELAHWFDEHFPPLRKVRSYARPSRRQSATPDIPRPRWVLEEAEAEKTHTYGVLLDTSGSMDRNILAKALGTISSYSIARDVTAVRVVFCDAVTYDQGYMSPEEIGGRVKVRGRGGTILQPGVDLLERAQDFPRDGPLLIITDGFCDHLQVRREHAYLLPRGHQLPFTPRGKVFYIA